jgi:hypothetical protein
MRRAPLLALLAAATLPAARAAHAQGDYTARRDTTIDARDARRIEVEARGGILRITGVAGLTEVRVRGTARASHRELLDGIRLVARREGDRVVVRADIDEERRGWRTSWRGDWYHGLDLVIDVPAGIAADVDDGSGELEIRRVGALDLRDGSGSIEIEDVESARIEDGSGEIRIRAVRGDVRVRDGSGGIDADDVRGAVIVERDGSGGVSARHVGGDLIVEQGRASRIDYADVRGRVQIPEDRRARRRY